MENKFTIEEIRNYLKSQDSLGDIMYNLNEGNIKKANKAISFTLQEILDSGYWEEFCEKYGINEWAINEGGGDIEKDIFIADEKRYKLI